MKLTEELFWSIIDNGIKRCSTHKITEKEYCSCLIQCILEEKDMLQHQEIFHQIFDECMDSLRTEKIFNRYQRNTEKTNSRMIVLKVL